MRSRALTFRAKLLSSYLGLVAVVEVITILVLNQSLAADLVRHLDQRLEEQARGAAVWISARREQHGERSDRGGGDRPGGDRDRHALRLAGVVHASVTIIDEKGVVVGDSDRTPGQAHARLSGESSQPEVLAARAGDIGRATRYSIPHGAEMHFVAVPGEGGQVVRLGVRLAEVSSTIQAMRNRLLVASALAFFVAIVLGLVAARVIARPLRAMTSSASRIAQGDYDIEVPAGSPDEFGTLARSLASLGSQLKARIGDLTNERDRLSAILAGMVEGVLVIDPNDRLVVANPSAGQILGVLPPLVGLTLGEVVRDPRVRRVLEHADAKRELTEVELGVGESGSRSLVINVRPLAPSAGGGAVAVLHDVTQLRRLEGMRREFVANVSHELRTPVAAIQGYAETLLRGAETLDPPTRAEFLDVIHRHARRIGRLVEDLLQLSEIEARPPEKIARVEVPIGDVAANVADTARGRLVAKGIALSVDLASDVVAIGDPDGIEQVLDNLVDNAIKYGRAGGRIAITGAREAERVRVSIADDGPGIAPEHLTRIFERFYRVHQGRSRELGGTGLGLAIVKTLLESMGGTIVAESEPNKGTRFVVSLPAAPARMGEP